MVDLGVTSIENIEQIVSFFKIEKLYQLIFDEDPKEDDVASHKEGLAGQAGSNENTARNLNAQPLPVKK